MLIHKLCGFLSFLSDPLYSPKDLFDYFLNIHMAFALSGNKDKTDRNDKTPLPLVDMAFRDDSFHHGKALTMTKRTVRRCAI